MSDKSKKLDKLNQNSLAHMVAESIKSRLILCGEMSDGKIQDVVFDIDKTPTIPVFVESEGELRKGFSIEIKKP